VGARADRDDDEGTSPADATDRVAELTPRLARLSVRIVLPRLVRLFPTNGEYTVPLPAAVRPANFYVQGVGLTPLGLAVTDGYQVIAF
jgi:hypothetical protein